MAEGELKLVEVMTKAKAYVQTMALFPNLQKTLISSLRWEDLEEKPAEGQWTYFTRGTDMGKTQTPPQTK